MEQKYLTTEQAAQVGEKLDFKWDKLKGYNLNTRQFHNVVTGKNDVIKGLDYYFNENSL